MTLIREVRYTPLLCRWGWHKWDCLTHGADASWMRLFQIRCHDLAAHVHACRRCDRVRLVGRVARTEEVRKLLEARRS